jgi:hypothetical protein
MTSTNWSGGTHKSTNWSGGTNYTSNWTGGTNYSVNWGSEGMMDFSDGFLLLQTGDNILLQSGGKIAKQ